MSIPHSRWVLNVDTDHVQPIFVRHQGKGAVGRFITMQIDLLDGRSAVLATASIALKVRHANTHTMVVDVDKRAAMVWMGGMGEGGFAVGVDDMGGMGGMDDMGGMGGMDDMGGMGGMGGMVGMGGTGGMTLADPDDCPPPLCKKRQRPADPDGVRASLSLVISLSRGVCRWCRQVCARARVCAGWV
jgi:hypothetical protein